MAMRVSMRACKPHACLERTEPCSSPRGRGDASHAGLSNALPQCVVRAARAKTCTGAYLDKKRAGVTRTDKNRAGGTRRA